MPATRSTRKEDTGKAGAPKTPAKAAPKAASRTTPRPKPKQATKVSSSSDHLVSSSPAKTRSRAPEASAALTLHATSYDPPSSSPARARGGKGKATNVPDQFVSSSGPSAPSPANTRSSKRKAVAAVLEQTAASPPAKTRRQSTRVTSRASTAEPVVVPMYEDTCDEKNDVGRPGPVSQTEGQDTDSSLSTIDSDLFDEETKNKTDDQKPEVKDVPMTDAAPEPDISTILAVANVASPNPALHNIDTTAASDQGQKPEVAAPVSTIDLEPKFSTATTTPAQVSVDLVSAGQAISDTTDATAGSLKPQAEAKVLKTIKKSRASVTTTAADRRGPVSSDKSSISTKATSSGGRKSRATSKATPRSTASVKAATAANKLKPISSPHVGSDGYEITLEHQTSRAKDSTSRVDSTTTVAEEAPNQIPARVPTDSSKTVNAQDLKSPLKDHSEPDSSKASPEVAANKPEQIETVEDDNGTVVIEPTQIKTVEKPGKDLCGRPTSAGEETARSLSEFGANITPAPVSGNSPLYKDVPELEVSTTAATPSPRLPLATSSISPLSGAVNQHPPITPNATSPNILTENEPRQPQQNGSPEPPEELVLTGQSFKVLWPVYQDLRKLVESKDEQGKEVVDSERKLLWKLYEQCRELKSQLDLHERRRNERKKI